MKTKTIINFLLSLMLLTGLLSISQSGRANRQACSPGPHAGGHYK